MIKKLLMKKLLTLLIVAAAAFVAAPKAEARPPHAGHTYVSGRSSCGCVVYSQRFIAYYDHCGRPVYSVRALPVTHRCRHAVQYRRAQYRPHYSYPSRSRGYDGGHSGRQSHSRGSYYSSGQRCR